MFVHLVECYPHSLHFGWYDEIIRAKLIDLVGEKNAMEIDNYYPNENPVLLPNGIEFNKLNIDGKFEAMNGPYIPHISGSNAGQYMEVEHKQESHIYVTIHILL
jgi:hypothetical protein